MATEMLAPFAATSTPTWSSSSPTTPCSRASITAASSSTGWTWCSTGWSVSETGPDAGGVRARIARGRSRPPAVMHDHRQSSVSGSGTRHSPAPLQTFSAVTSPPRAITPSRYSGPLRHRPGWAPSAGAARDGRPRWPGGVRHRPGGARRSDAARRCSSSSGWRCERLGRQPSRAAPPRGGRDLEQPPVLIREVPDVDRGWLHVERRERGADLAPMVGPVVQRLRQSDAHRRVALGAVVAVAHHDEVRVELPAPRARTTRRRRPPSRPELGEVHVVLVDARDAPSVRANR